MNTSKCELRNISLVPVAQVLEGSIEILKERLPNKFPGAACYVAEVPVDIENSLNPQSGQHHSTKLLAALEKHADVDEDKLLGVTDLDLYIPNMNFVFGEARLPGRVAIISTRRLRESTDCGGERLFPIRVVKEAVHELGHTLGLAHCDTHSCVMYFSNSLRDTDRKSEDYCTSCSKKLGISR